MDEVYLRKAEHYDMDLLYEWTNDSEVRSNSFNTDLIPYEDHVKWFNSIMKNESVLQFIMMEGDSPIGQIRLNIDGNSAEISYSIGKTHRGKGYGHKILQLATEEIERYYPHIRYLIARVKPDNDSSNNIFKNEGYALKYLCYEKSTDR